MRSVDYSIVIIVNFHSLIVFLCLCKGMSSFLGNTLDQADAKDLVPRLTGKGYRGSAWGDKVL